MALSFAKLWHARAGRVEVPTGGIVRRALQVYAQHLDNIGQHRSAEVRAVERACKASQSAEEAHRDTEGRTRGTDAAEVLAAPGSVLRDPAGGAERAQGRA